MQEIKMIKGLYNHIKTQDLNKENVEEQLLKFDDSKMENFLIGCMESIPLQNISKGDKIHELSFMSSREFSADSGKCINIGCIDKRINYLQRFATLYSDRTYVFNPFEKFLSSFPLDRDAKIGLARDIHVILELEKVICEGLIIFVTQEFHFCPGCCDKLLKTKENETANLKGILAERVKEMGEEFCKFYIEENDKDSYLVTVEPKDYDFWAQKMTAFTIRKENECQIIKTALNRKTNRIYKNEVRRTELYDFFVNKIVDEIIEHNYYSDLTNSHFLSMNITDMHLVSEYNKEVGNLEHFDILDSLSHAVPILNELKIEDVIEMRKKEGESFINYRYEMQKLYNERPANKELSEYFRDIILPRLAEIESASKKFKRTKKKSLIYHGFSAAAYLTAGIFGVLPSTFANSLAALGGFNHGKDFGAELLSLNRNNTTEDKFYFLWQLTKSSI